MEFEDFACITTQMAAQLRKAGVNTVEVLAMQTFQDLREVFGKIPDEKIRGLQREVWEATGYWFTPADKLVDLRKQELVFSTGCKALDGVLGGGVRSRCITEFAGEYGSGKTQSIFTAMVETLASHSQFTVIFFDSEECFREARIREIARTRGYGPDDLMKRVILVPVLNSDHFSETVHWSTDLIKNRNVRLLIVDSIVAPLRSEYVGREVLSQRQQLLNRILRDLLNYAKAFNLAVAVTNQVVANPQALYSMDPTQNNKPTGGHILAHNVETRIYLRKAEANKRIAHLLDSSCLAPSECVFQITEKGIEDLPEAKPVEPKP